MRAFDGQTGADPVVTTSPEQQTLVALERLDAELDLTQQQSDEIQIILDEHIMLEADLLAQMRALQQQGRAEIMRLLTDEQKKKFERLLVRRSALTRAAGLHLQYPVFA